MPGLACSSSDSLLARCIEDDILDTCCELGIAVTAYGVLSRGPIGTPKQHYEVVGDLDGGAICGGTGQ